MDLGGVVDVALTSKAEGCGFDPQLDARFLPQHVDPQINWVVTWLWLIVKRLELSQDEALHKSLLLLLLLLLLVVVLLLFIVGTKHMIFIFHIT